MTRRRDPDPAGGFQPSRKPHEPVGKPSREGRRQKRAWRRGR